MDQTPNRTQPVVIEETFDAPMETVWRALTDEDQMREWFFPMMESFKPEVGFYTEFNLHHNGKDYLHQWTVTDVTPGKKLICKWTFAGYEGASYVTYELAEENGGTKLTLTDEGRESFPRDNPDFSAESCAKGWNFLIGERLRAFLEEGKVIGDD